MAKNTNHTDFAALIKGFAAEDGSIPEAAINAAVTAIKIAVGNEYVDKDRYTEKLAEIRRLNEAIQTAEDNAATAPSWKEQYEAAKAECEKYKSDLDATTAELEVLKSGDWESKYNALQENIAAKESKAAKERAVRAYFEGKSITGKEQEIAMLSAASAIDGVELKKDGSIKDVSTLDALVSGTLAPLVSGIHTAPAHNPPEFGGNTVSGAAKTAEEILAIKDDAEMVRAIEENPAAFGLA